MFDVIINVTIDSRYHSLAYLTQMGHDCLELATERANQLSWVELSFTDMNETNLQHMSKKLSSWVELSCVGRHVFGFTAVIFDQIKDEYLKRSNFRTKQILNLKFLLFESFYQTVCKV
jgi:hypothetical protein